MADIRWTGEGVATAQVDTFTPANVEVDDIFTLTIAGLDGTSTSISFTATAATVANVTAGLTTAWNASTHALCTPITASDQTTYMDLTADTAGVAFYVTSSATDGGGTDDQTLTRAVGTANGGPQDWSDANNWDSGSVPGGAASQDVYIDFATEEIIYGLDQSGISNTLNSLNIGQSFTGKIGYNGATGYSGTYLQIKSTTVNIGQHNGSGSPTGSTRLMINTGSTASTINIYNSASTSADSNKPAIRLLANSASTVINVNKGAVGVAYESGESATVGTIRQSYVNNQSTDASSYISDGVTLTTLYKTGGTCELECGATTVTNDFGSIKTTGSGAITTFNHNGGTATLNSTGTITTLNALGGLVDMTKDQKAKTVTTLKLDNSGQFKYDPSVVTLTNKIVPYDTTGEKTVTII